MSAFFAIITAELFKVSRRKRLMLLASLYWIVLPVILLLVTPTLRSAVTDAFSGSRVLMQALASPYGLTQIGAGVGGYASPSLYLVIVAVVASALLGDEARFSTWKSLLVLQPRRLSVLFGKIVAGHVVVFFILLGNLLGSIAVAGVGTFWLETTFAGNWSTLLWRLVLQWLFLLTPLIFAFLVTFYIRSTSLAMVVILFLMPVAELIQQILANVARFNPLSQMAHFFRHGLIRPWWDALPDWYFTTNAFSPSRDIFNPVLNMMGGGAQMTAKLGYGHSILVLTVYGVIFLALLVPVFLRRDVP